MEMLINAVAWIEIPVSNFDRARSFYSKIYDYEMPEMMLGKNRMGFLLYDRQASGIGGAIVAGPGYTPSAGGTKVYLNGGLDLNIVLNRVMKAGGEVLVEKTLVGPELGFFAVFKDTEGNQIALHSVK